MRRSILITFVMLLAGISSTAYSQPTPIVADPNAHRLRLLWHVTGGQFGGGQAGDGIGALGDIYGTGTTAWAVNYGTPAEWRIYNGYTGNRALDTIPVQVKELYFANPYRPVVGDFWGTGHNAVGFARGSSDTSDPERPQIYYGLHMYRSEENRLADTPSARLNMRTMTPAISNLAPDNILTIDVDEDGVDDLVIPWGVARRLGGAGGEVWIFKGGENFQLDTPTVSVRIPATSGLHDVNTGDFNGDGHQDIVLMRTYPTPFTLHFFFGDGTLEGYGKPENQRAIELGADHPRTQLLLGVLDCDGDGITDVVLNEADGPNLGAYVYRSRTGKSAHTRSYHFDDADNSFAGTALIRRGGYLNDTTRRYEMLLLLRDAATTLLAFSGGTNGPDNAYDAYYDSDSPLYLQVQPVPDINNDGWDDLMTGNYTVGLESGVAVILAGGPEIPVDPTMGVEAIAGEGHQQAIAVWPNPMRTELHIAWRGDLKRMPSKFTVHDVAGSLVASGEVEPGAGAALWHATDAPAGTYILTVYDRTGNQIATKQVVRIP